VTKASIRTRRFSVLCSVAAVVSLGWSPLQASAADGATAAVGSTVDASLDPVDTVSGTVDAISDATTSTVETVSNTTSGTADTVSNTASGTVDTVSNTISDTVDTVSNTISGTVSNTTSGTVGGVSDTVGDATAAVQGPAGSVGTAAQASSSQADQSSATTGATSPRFSSEQQAAATRAESAIGDEGHGSCVAASTACQATMDGTEPGSWTRSVADIIRKLLALTGFGVLSWIVASCFLALAGMLLLHQARDRSELGSARPS
jgi:hypothetical protein